MYPLFTVLSAAAAGDGHGGGRLGAGCSASCAHLCLLMPANTRCMCADGYRLAADERRCTALDDYTDPLLCADGQFQCAASKDCISST